MDSEAALSMIERALNTESQTIAYLLIDSAHRLDDGINVTAIRRQWLDGWLAREYQAMIERNNQK